jgi:hypothetical protein
MQSDAQAARQFARYGLEDIPRISDPERRLYAAFSLKRGSPAQVLGPAVWLRGLKSLLGGHLPGVPSGDVLQMPGAFLVYQGRVLRAFRHESTAERPDYSELAQCPLPNKPD